MDFILGIITGIVGLRFIQKRKSKIGPCPIRQDPSTHPLYPAYLEYRAAFGIDDLPPGAAVPQVYVLPFPEWLLEQTGASMDGAPHGGRSFQSPIDGPGWMY